MIRRLFILLLISFSGAAIAAGWILQEERAQPIAVESDQTYIVASGASLGSVLADMEAKGWIRYAKLWRYYFQLQELTNIKRGEYRLEKGMTLQQVVELLNQGEVVSHKITLIEGQTYKAFKQALLNSDKLEHVLPNMSDDEIRAALNISENYLEGWFYPDTYFFHKGDTDLDVLKRAHDKMQQVLAEQWQQRAKDLPYKSPYEALIMASIVEKETAHLPEQTQIAGVFVRRLKIDMMLQTDPTVIYGLGDAFDGNLTRKHLRTPSAYNTYTMKGLPPSPIANPGIHAITAALNPDDSNTLYFVAKGDGTSYFSETLAEHNEAVKRLQRFNRTQNYQSTPSK